LLLPGFSYVNVVDGIVLLRKYLRPGQLVELKATR
jgi:hypothetical protein